MRRSRITIGIASALALVAIGAADVAGAQHRGHDDRGGWSDRSDRAPYDRPQDHRRDRHDPRPDERDRRSRCQNSGSDGTIIGAIAGGLLGNSIAGAGRIPDTLSGGGAGAMAGRAIDRGC